MSGAKRRKDIQTNHEGEEGKLNCQVQTNNDLNDKGEVLATGREITKELLPPEILELIFRNVESPKDLLSCWNTTSSWATALRSTEFYFKMTLPFILPYLSHRDLLQCCSVSKSWNAAADVSVLAAEDFDSDKRLTKNQRIVSTIYSTDKVKFVNRVEVFLNNDIEGESHPVNPVAFRRVEVKLILTGPWAIKPSQRNHDPLASYRKLLLQRLDRHGHLIRYLHLTMFGGESVSCLDKIKLIRSCLERTPNLRALNISMNSESEEANEETEAINAFINSTPWPVLKHLKVLKFDPVTVQDQFASIAYKYGPQLLYLQVRYQLMHPLQRHAMRFRCLQEIVFVDIGLVGGAVLGDFVRYSKCQLKHLTIVLSGDPWAEGLKGFSLAANAVSATLETLVFRPTKHTLLDCNISQLHRMRLPRLKTLRLYDFGYPSLEFLLSVCPGLQKLQMTPAFSHEVRESSQLYCDLYSEHEFWAEMAEIQTVDVEYKFGPKSYVINGGKGRKIKRHIPGGKVRKVYVRRVYDAKLEEEST